MSRAKGKKNSTDSDDSDDVIIEAEIVDEKPQANKAKSSSTTQASVNTKDLPPVKNMSARIGWSITLLLVAFIGGIFMQPMAQESLIQFGLMTAQPEQQAPIDLAPLTLAQQQQSDHLNIIEANLATQSATLDALQKENDGLKRDLATLAAGLPVGSPDAMPTQALSEMTERLTLLETSLLDVKSTATVNQTESSIVARLDGDLKLARAETAQLLERLSAFEKTFEISQSTKLSASPEGRAAVTLHRLYLKATAGADFSADIAALKPDLVNLPLLDLQRVSQSLTILERNQGGIATHSDIVRGFNAIIPEILKADVADEATGWLANFFTIRRTDVRATGVEAVIRAIENHLANRDLVAAKQSADSLPDPVKASLSEWQATMMARHNAMQALTQLLTTLAGDAG